MKKENEGAYGFDRSQPDYAKKVLEESRRQISDAARTLGRRGRAVNSPAQQQAARENGKLGGWVKGRPRKPNSGSGREEAKAMTKAAERFLTEVSEGAWSDSPEPWEQTAKLGLAEVDATCIEAYAGEYGEDASLAQEEVLAAVRARQQMQTGK